MDTPDPIPVRCYGKDGPFAILLHGGPGAPGEMAPLARSIENRFRILEPFQRTSGDVPLTVARHVADLHRVLRGPLQEGPVRLAGYSWGAMLALTYAARYPHEIDRVVLIGCGTFDAVSRREYRACMARRSGAEDRKRIRIIEGQLAGETDTGRRNRLFAELGAVFSRIQCHRPAEKSAQDPVPFPDERGFNETWRDALHLQDRGLQPREFAGIRAPVTMIHGDRDPHPGKMIYRILKRYVDNIRYIGIPECGHTPWIEEKAAGWFTTRFNEALGADTRFAITRADG